MINYQFRDPFKTVNPESGQNLISNQKMCSYHVPKLELPYLLFSFFNEKIQLYIQIFQLKLFIHASLCADKYFDMMNWVILQTSSSSLNASRSVWKVKEWNTWQVDGCVIALESQCSVSCGMRDTYRPTIAAIQK